MFPPEMYSNCSNSVFFSLVRHVRVMLNVLCLFFCSYPGNKSLYSEGYDCNAHEDENSCLDEYNYLDASVEECINFHVKVIFKQSIKSDDNFNPDSTDNHLVLVQLICVKSNNIQFQWNDVKKDNLKDLKSLENASSEESVTVTDPINIFIKAAKNVKNSTNNDDDHHQPHLNFCENVGNISHLSELNIKEKEYQVSFCSVSVPHPSNINNIPWQFMRKEWWRLHTFSKYPKNALSFTTLLARQGFVYIGNGEADNDTVICVFCMSGANNLDHSYNIEEFHRKLNANCPIVRGVNCGNVLMKHNGMSASDIFLQLERGGNNSSKCNHNTQDYDHVDHHDPMESDSHIHHLDTPMDSAASPMLQKNTHDQDFMTVKTPGHINDNASNKNHPQASEKHASSKVVTNNAQSLFVLGPADNASPDATNQNQRDMAETTTKALSGNASSNYQATPRSETRSTLRNQFSSPFYSTNSHASNGMLTRSGSSNPPTNDNSFLNTNPQTVSDTAEVFHFQGGTSSSNPQSLNITNDSQACNEPSSSRSGSSNPPTNDNRFLNTNPQTVQDNAGVFQEEQSVNSSSNPLTTIISNDSSPPNQPAPTVDSSHGHTTSYEKLGIITSRPKRYEYAVESTRLNSFEGWPPNHHISTGNLAKAGYFYTGYSDCARCFHCGGGLRNWEVGDDVWVEHARWFPKCAFMRQSLGQPFIDVVQDLNKDHETIAYEDVIDQMKIRDLEHAVPYDIKDRYYELERDAAVKTIMSCGFNESDVLRVAEKLKDENQSLAADKLYDELLKRNVPQNSGGIKDKISSQSVNTKATEQQDEETIEYLKQENTQLRQQSLCKICMDKEVSVVFLPCGHLVSCNDCSFALKLCPVCRNGIKGVVRAYLG